MIRASSVYARETDAQPTPKQPVPRKASAVSTRRNRSVGLRVAVKSGRRGSSYSVRSSDEVPPSLERARLAVLSGRPDMSLGSGYRLVNASRKGRKL